MSKVFAQVFRQAYAADPLFWIFKTPTPTAFSQMMGIPKGVSPTSEEAQVMAGLREPLFPLRPRRERAVLDGFISNLAADRFPLEQLASPRWSSAPETIRLAPYRQRHRTGDNQQDQLQAHKPKIIPRPGRPRPDSHVPDAGPSDLRPADHPARWHGFSAPTKSSYVAESVDRRDAQRVGVCRWLERNHRDHHNEQCDQGRHCGAVGGNGQIDELRRERAQGGWRSPSSADAAEPMGS